MPDKINLPDPNEALAYLLAVGVLGAVAFGLLRLVVMDLAGW